MKFTEKELLERVDPNITNGLVFTKDCVTMLTDFLDPHMQKDKSIYDAVSDVFDFENFFLAQLKEVSEEEVKTVETIEDAAKFLNAKKFLCIESGMRISKKLLDIIEAHKLNFPEVRKIQWMIKSVFDTETLNLGNC
ncbi:hypothetical protein [Desulfonatronum parangueonense]